MKKALVTRIDESTDLMKIDEQVAIRWAGCVYGPADSITEVANGDLLATSRKLLDDPDTQWREIDLIDADDGLGYVELPSDGNVAKSDVLQQGVTDSITSPSQFPRPSVKTIAFTGGPGAGKSSLLPKIADQLRADGMDVYIVPEAATILILGGYDASALKTNSDHYGFQVNHVGLQKQLEDTFKGLAHDRMQITGKSAVVLCDRGLLDGEAYYPVSTDAFFEDVLAAHELTRDQVLNRYQKVVHLETQAAYDLSSYAGRENPARWQNAEQAVESDYKLKTVWMDHPEHSVIAASAHIDEKFNAALGVVRAALLPPVMPTQRGVSSAGIEEIAAFLGRSPSSTPDPVFSLH